MKDEKPTGTNRVNILLDIHTQLSQSPVIFRERVCEECDWSTPTFYRKMRGRDKFDPHDKNKIIRALSNAEKQKIQEVLEEGIIQLTEKCQPYMKSVSVSRKDTAYK